MAYCNKLIGTLLGLATLLAACQPGEVTQVDPSDINADAPDVPQVNRTTLTVHAAVDSVDRALADSLGWRDGIPGAEINILRNGTADWSTVLTDSSGTFRFTNMIPGLYRVYGARTLTDGEAARLGGVVRAFGDGRTISVSVEEETTLELSMIADRPRSLVISEIGNGAPVPWETGGTGYQLAYYFEIYNNSDKMMYLDGMLFGMANLFIAGRTLGSECSESQAVRTDPEGIHALGFLRFPGSGMEHPIGPGETRTVAVAAIDHRPIHPTLIDMSDADFEMGLSGGANNPSVPDMINVGQPTRFLPRWLLGTRHVYFLSLPLDVASLPVGFRDNTGRERLRVPKDKLIDVIALRSIRVPDNAVFPPCIPIVARSFNRYEGGFLNISFDTDPTFPSTRSLQRRVLRIGPGGRKILYNTRTSAVDFFRGVVPRTWRTLP
ncbi:MAG: hypothetical protein ACE5I7_13755 [Candidatus Binatia bacterium]